MIIKNALVFQEDGSFVPKNIYILGDTFCSEPEYTSKYISNMTLANKENQNKTFRDISNCGKTAYDYLTSDNSSINTPPSSDAIIQEEFILDASNLYAIPGLIDIHLHGCAGYDFSEGTFEAMEHIAEYQLNHGITTFVPATMSLSEETLANICTTSAKYYKLREHGAIFAGINLEGPFLSKVKKGAQNERYLVTPDIQVMERLLDYSNNLIQLITIAPELPKAMEFIKHFKQDKIISIGHTTADYHTALKALENGTSHITHLYNAMPPFLHREPGVVGAAFDHGNCTVELICDGNHLHPSVVRSTFSMFTDDRIILVSDSMMATGLEDGMYSLGELPVRKKGNLAVLGNKTLAGSITNLMDCLRIAVKKMNIPLESAVKCATINPAKKLGISDRYGSISDGKMANVVLLDKELNVRNVIFKGVPL